MLVHPAGREQEQAVAVKGEDRAAPPIDQGEDDVDGALAETPWVVGADDEVRELVDQVRSARHGHLLQYPPSYTAAGGDGAARVTVIRITYTSCSIRTRIRNRPTYPMS